MRGPAERQAKMLMGVTTEDFIPVGHPIRRVRKLVDELLAATHGDVRGGRPLLGPARAPDQGLASDGVSTPSVRNGSFANGSSTTCSSNRSWG